MQKPAPCFDQDAADTALVNVDIRLIEIERTCIGRIRAFAAVEIEVAGIIFAVQGITVGQDGRGHVFVDLPTYRRDGRASPVIVLPAELYEPTGRLVLEAYRSA